MDSKGVPFAYYAEGQAVLLRSRKTPAAVKPELNTPEPGHSPTRVREQGGAACAGVFCVGSAGVVMAPGRVPTPRATAADTGLVPGGTGGGPSSAKEQKQVWWPGIGNTVNKRMVKPEAADPLIRKGHGTENGPGGHHTSHRMSSPTGFSQGANCWTGESFLAPLGLKSNAIESSPNLSGMQAAGLPTLTVSGIYVGDEPGNTGFMNKLRPPKCGSGRWPIGQTDESSNLPGILSLNWAIRPSEKSRSFRSVSPQINSCRHPDIFLCRWWGGVVLERREDFRGLVCDGCCFGADSWKLLKRERECPMGNRRCAGSAENFFRRDRACSVGLSHHIIAAGSEGAS